MAIPSEQDKLNGDTSYSCMGKVTVGDKVVDVEIKTETKPNATGGYDTRVKIPMAQPIGAVNETGGG